MKTEKFCPTLINSLRKYNITKFLKDSYAGIIVAIIALPLSIALAISSGVRPENGLYSAIIGGVVVSLFSGSKVQIGGITAATVMTVCTIISQYGLSGLAIASIMAGIFLIIMGFCKVGSLLKYIPITITTGFTAGIAIGIFTSQIKEFFGLTIEKMPIPMLAKWNTCIRAMDTVYAPAIIVSVLSIAILVIIPYITKKIPNTLVMIIIMTTVVQVFKVPVATIQSVYGEVPNHFPTFKIPEMSVEMIMNLIAPSITLAILIAIVSLLSCVVTDGLIGKRHNSNMELIAQGIANICCGFFQAVPVAGAVARSSNSVKTGGKSQVVGIVHSVVVLLMLLFLMPLVGYIPMPSLSALLMVVAYKMINWEEIRYTIKHAPKSDAIVLIVTILTAICFDLMTSVEVGIMLTAFLFLKRMADVTTVESWKYLEEEEEDPDGIDLREVPKHTEVFEICGPMFFAASDKLLSIAPEDRCRCLILRMRSVSAIDATAMHRLEQLLEHCNRRHITLVLSHVNEQPMSVIEKSTFLDKLGKDNFCIHIDDALKRAEQVCMRRKEEIK